MLTERYDCTDENSEIRIRNPKSSNSFPHNPPHTMDARHFSASSINHHLLGKIVKDDDASLGRLTAEAESFVAMLETQYAENIQQRVSSIYEEAEKIRAALAKGEQKISTTCQLPLSQNRSSAPEKSQRGPSHPTRSMKLIPTHTPRTNTPRKKLSPPRCLSASDVGIFEVGSHALEHDINSTALCQHDLCLALPNAPLDIMVVLGSRSELETHHCIKKVKMWVSVCSIPHCSR